MTNTVHIFIIILDFLQVKGIPDVTYHNLSNTIVRASFISDRIVVQKEEEAFSFGTLVADCGGILGLFLGFNFLMIWEWLIKFCSFFQFVVNKKQS